MAPRQPIEVADLIADGHRDGFGGPEPRPDSLERLGPGWDRFVAATRPGDLRVPRRGLPPLRTAGQKRRFRRDLVIYLASSRGGLSQRLLAGVFDLPRSRIAAIVQAMARHDPTSPDAEP